MVEEFESVLVRKLDDWVLQAPDLLEHLAGDLWVQADGAVLELVEGAVERLVDGGELVLEPLHLLLVLDQALLEVADLRLQLAQVRLSPLDVLLTFH